MPCTVLRLLGCNTANVTRPASLKVERGHPSESHFLCGVSFFLEVFPICHTDLV